MNHSRAILSLLSVLIFCFLSVSLPAAATEEPVNKPKVLKIVVFLGMPDGTTEARVLDPKGVEAIFWTDQSVNEVLAPTYSRIERWVTEAQLVELFGKKILDVIKPLPLERRMLAGLAEIRMSPDIIRHAWKYLLIPYVCKLPPCLSGSCPSSN